MPRQEYTVVYLFQLAAAFALGYMIVVKAAPVVQAKIDSQRIDDAWETLDAESSR